MSDIVSTEHIDATAIPEVPCRKLGKLQAKGNMNQLVFRDYIKTTADVPEKFNFWGKRKPIPFYDTGNTEMGNCTRASQAVLAAYMERLEQRKTIQISKAEIVRVYVEMSDRLYGGGDNGAYELDALNCWRNPDFTFRDNKGRPHTIDAYARINHFDIKEIKKALFLAGAKGIKVCFDLPMAWAWETNHIWDIPEGQAPTGKWQIGSWGGHCVSQNTVIQLLNGKNVPIKDLEGQENIWVYGCLPNAQPYPVMAKKCVKTKFAKTLRINIDNGSHIELTPEHLVMLRDGTYAEAGKLRVGDRLMPLRRIIHHRGYEKLKWYDEAKMQCFTHRMVAESLGCPKNKIAHHADGNKRNNHPDNIEFMTQTEHMLLHEPWKSSPTWNKHLSNQELNEVPFSENHKVLSIEEGEEQWVYDLLDCSPTQNFAANGIFVHNSCTSIANYNADGLEVPSTWNEKSYWMTWRAFATYCSEAYLTIDSINQWKKMVDNKTLNLKALVSDVNNISAIKIK